jgi:7,8-dihydropterin-6-yl-methyl-4-(beta-D-ribofuranosyl)aminobenzene 5'-phosphate synthase
MMKKLLRIFALVSLAGMILFFGISFLRLQLARYKISKDNQALTNTGPLEFGETSTLEILPLYENASLAGLQSGHGVSYLIRTDSVTILFDLGNNMTAASPSPLEQNMADLGISLDEVDMIVISHRHPDHLGGQNWWMKKTFSIDGVTQTSLGNIQIYIPEEMTYPDHVLTLSKTPTSLSKGIATTGIIAYVQPFPVWLATPKGDEQALAVNVSGRGIVLITGCGHMGLKALLARAETVFEAPVIGVIGGLHYGNKDIADLQAEVQMLRDLHPLILALSPHDSGQSVLDGFTEAFPDSYAPIIVGETISISAKSAMP